MYIRLSSPTTNRRSPNTRSPELAHQLTHLVALSRNLYLLDLFLQSSFEKLEQQVLLPLIRGIIVQCEDNRVHELRGLVLWHLENQLSQVRRFGLQDKGGSSQPRGLEAGVCESRVWHLSFRSPMTERTMRNR